MDKKFISKKNIAVLIIAVVAVLVIWVVSDNTRFDSLLNFFDFTRNAPASGEENTTISSNINPQKTVVQDTAAIWLREGTDFPGTSTHTMEQIKSIIDGVFSKLTNDYIDTVFVELPVDFEKFAEFDSVLYILEKAKSAEMKSAVALKSELLYHEGTLAPNSDKLAAISLRYNPDSFILLGLDNLPQTKKAYDEINVHALSDSVKALVALVKANNSDAKLGADINAVWANKTTANPYGTNTKSSRQSLYDYNADTMSWAKEGIFDFLYLGEGLSTTSTELIMNDILTWWDIVLRDSASVGVLGINTGNIAESELLSQIKMVPSLSSFSGFCFNSYNSLYLNESVKNKYTEYMKAKSAASLNVGELVVSRPPSDNTVTNESAITFAGNSDPNLPLYFNNQEIPRSKLGIFSFDVTLNPGENKFTFTHNNVSKVYTVNYNFDILTNVEPKGKTEAVGGTIIEIAALCHKDASVYAQISGTKVPMRATGSNYFKQSAAKSDFATFIGTYTMPEADKGANLGKITVYASLSGKSDKLEGGSVIVVPELTSGAVSQLTIKPTTYKSLYEIKSYPLKTAYSNHNLGNAVMCEVLKDYGETTPANIANDFSDVLYTPLIKGTFDYVKGVVTYDDELHYILESGKKIYAKDAKIIAEGNVMPKNTLSVTSSGTNKTTDIVIKTDWLVPTNSLLSPQQYYMGYQEKKYNVDNFTAEYLDLTFYYTNKASGNINVSGSNVVSEASFINVGKDDTVTLRLKLKNPGHFYGYSLTLDDSGAYRISIKNRSEDLKNKVIMLDPGHGGNDPGAIGIYNTIFESSLNISIARKTKAFLESMGATVVMTRSGDTTLSLDERQLLARTSKADLFIAIHNDASTSGINSGTHTFYYSPFSKALATSVQGYTVAAYRNGIFTPDMPEYASIDLGSKFYPFAVTRVEDCPAILIECGFITNAVNLNALLVDNNQNALAQAIAFGVRDYFKNF